MVLRECTAAGQGLAILPVFLGVADSRLERVTGLFPPMETGIWVASHVDLFDIPRIRAAREALVAGIGARAGLLQGKG
jgi:DNA-binding transcriptional LysR family regulator